MKMTLSAPSVNDTSSDIERENKIIETKSLSPSSSPRSSPRPSPRPQNKQEHSKSDTHLTVNYRDTYPQKHEGSPSSIESNGSNRNSTFEISPPSDSSKNDASSIQGKDRKEIRSKKKSSWFNSFYPTYKSRSEDFKRLFKDVPDDERLVVDYSCALQKDILVQGRLYVTQNYLCFYANIFGWETNLTLKWKEVAAITKEKTALVIPNAVLISTRTEKYFFTTFAARDKTYLMLFRVWQNALLDQPMTAQEMWQWVHRSYGAKLGLTSDDEDYIAPEADKDKLSARLSVDSFSEQDQECVSTTDGIMDLLPSEDLKSCEESHYSNGLEMKHSINADLQLPTDMSDTSESDMEKTTKCETKVQCTAAHEGRILMNEVIPIHIDQLFTLLFTSSKFVLDFYASRKTTDLTQTPWTHNTSNSSKSRVVNLTVPISSAVGPKTSQVTETQVMLPCSKAGQLYAIDIEVVNAGIPYADSFYVCYHYCIQKLSETDSSMAVYAQIKYKKSVWGLVKGMIEKNCWYGLEDFFNALSKALQAEGEERAPNLKRKSRRKKRTLVIPRAYTDDSSCYKSATGKIKTASTSLFSSETSTYIIFGVLLLLLVLNIMLYYKLWTLEETPPYTLLDLHVLKNPPKSHEEWIKLLQQQETLHTVEMQKWQRILKVAIKLLKQTEESLNELQHSIHPTHTEKVLTILQNNKDTQSTLDSAQKQDL